MGQDKPISELWVNVPFYTKTREQQKRLIWVRFVNMAIEFDVYELEDRR